MSDYCDIGHDLDLLCEAVDMAGSGCKLTAGNVQRRMRVGFAKAARLLDLLEHYGVASARDSHGERRPLIGVVDIARTQERLRSAAAASEVTDAG
jgi:DNA segregation ATPase FtsK/SpoIIIE-like protein